MTTAERILGCALQLFNQRGIENVGIREIAATLDMRVGNLTYYYPTKNDVIGAIAMQLRDLNNRTIVVQDGMHMMEFLNMQKQVMKNQSEYICLFRSFVNLFENHNEIATAYKKTEKHRFSTLHKILNELVENKYMRQLKVTEVEFLVSTLSFINRFWSSEAAVTYRNLSFKKQQSHYLELIARLLQPYSTKKGMSQIDEFINQLQ
ncbi:MAG: TetR/AcrR family transcriptional regulator [Flavobacteriales bacterium]